MDNMETLRLQSTEWEEAEAKLCAQLALQEEEVAAERACDQEVPASQGSSSAASRKESASNGTFQDI